MRNLRFGSHFRPSPSSIPQPTKTLLNHKAPVAPLEEVATSAVISIVFDVGPKSFKIHWNCLSLAKSVKGLGIFKMCEFFTTKSVSRI